MDMTAYTLCKENKLPIIVFDINDLDNLTKLAKEEKWYSNKHKIYLW